MTKITNGNTDENPGPFLERFDPRLVTNPKINQKNHVLGRDPVWLSYKGTMQFIDPYNDQAIATWDSVNKAPF